MLTCIISKGPDYWLYYTPERDADIAKAMRDAGGEWMSDCWKIPVDAALSALTAACREVWNIKAKRIAKREIRKIEETAKLKQEKLVETNKRKADTRRKVITGALVLKAMESDEEFSKRIFKLLDDGLKHDRDRVLFDFDK